MGGYVCRVPFPYTTGLAVDIVVVISGGLLSSFCKRIIRIEL